jgi:hypothetical protein
MTPMVTNSLLPVILGEKVGDAIALQQGGHGVVCYVIFGDEQLTAAYDHRFPHLPFSAERLRSAD